MESWSSTCWVAIQGAAAGDPAERERFARRYAPVARSYLEARWRSAGRTHDIDDAVQEVFLECFREGGALAKADPTRPGGFRGFLYGITRNVAARIEERRVRKREVAVDSSFADRHEGDEPGDLAAVFDKPWAISIMGQAWDLQERQAEGKDERARRRVTLLRLRFEDGLPIRDIAERFGEDAAKMHQEYALARKEFHRALREVVAFHLPGAERDIDLECQRLLESLAT